MSEDRQLGEEPEAGAGSHDPPDALAHYRDARYYDHAYARYKDDVAFYVSLARQRGGPVLELGVGTGRLAIALADAAQVDVVGVDRTASMLERCRERLEKKPRRVRERVELVEGDFRDARLGRTFSMVFAPFNAFQHLYHREDFERAFATCREHLAPGGLLALDVLVPDPASFVRDPAKWFGSRPITHPRDGLRYRYAERFVYDHETQVQTTYIRFTQIDDPNVVIEDKLPQRQIYPRELEAMMHYAGFDVLIHHGGFAGEPLDAWALSQAVVARRR